MMQWIKNFWLGMKAFFSGMREGLGWCRDVETEMDLIDIPENKSEVERLREENERLLDANARVQDFVFEMKVIETKLHVALQGKEDVIAEAARLLADQGVCPGSEADKCFSVSGYECEGDAEPCWQKYLAGHAAGMAPRPAELIADVQQQGGE